MPSFTTNYDLAKPNVNDPTDQDLWGGYLNTDLDTIDGQMFTNATSLAGKAASGANADITSLLAIALLETANGSQEMQLRSDQDVNFLNRAGTAQIAAKILGAFAAPHAVRMDQFEYASNHFIIPFWNGSAVVPFYIQWATGSASVGITAGQNASVTTNWPTPFPSACLLALSCSFGSSPTLLTSQLVSFNVNNATVNFANPSISGNYSAAPVIFGIGF